MLHTPSHQIHSNVGTKKAALRPLLKKFQKINQLIGNQNTIHHLKTL